MKNFFGYDFFDALRRKVIESAPVLMPVLKVIFQAFDGVLVHIGPLPTQSQLLEESWILLLQLLDLIADLVIVYLTRLELHDEPFQLPCVLSIVRALPRNK